MRAKASESEPSVKSRGIRNVAVSAGLTLLFIIGWRTLTQPEQPAANPTTAAPTPTAAAPTVSGASKQELPVVRSTPAPLANPTALDNALQELAAATTAEKRFYALDTAAKESFAAGQMEEARRYALEALDLAQRFRSNWNYGNAIHDGNMVLGRIAVKNGDLNSARDYLLKAGNTTGSPQLDSFGPNMSLAKDLLEKGDRETVLQYFNLCRQFWELHLNKLDEWSADVAAGNTPDFGANLKY